MLEAIIRVLAPHYCISCQKEDELLCDGCRVSQLLPVPSRCFLCQKMTHDYNLCVTCRKKTPLRHVWVGTEYTAYAQRLIEMYKFERARAGYVPIAQQLDEALPYQSWGAVTHVPTASTRIRTRGYDHAQLIAGSLARRRGLPCRSLLIRHGQARQVGADRALRLRQVQAFYSVKIVRPMPKSVLLIDDVTTTGATLMAAARCLRKSGVKHVDAAVFAQKV